MLEWATAAEIGTAGFRVLHRDKRTGEFRALSGRLLPASGRAAGGVYRFVDESASTSERLTYKIVEQELKGSEREHGPFTLEVQPGAGSPDPAGDGRGLPELAAPNLEEVAGRSAGCRWNA